MLFSSHFLIKLQTNNEGIVLSNVFGAWFCQSKHKGVQRTGGFNTIPTPAKIIWLWTILDAPSKYNRHSSSCEIKLTSRISLGIPSYNLEDGGMGWFTIKFRWLALSGSSEIQHHIVLWKENDPFWQFEVKHRRLYYKDQQRIGPWYGVSRLTAPIMMHFLDSRDNSQTLFLHNSDALPQSLSSSSSKWFARGLHHSSGPIKHKGHDPWLSHRSRMACPTEEHLRLRASWDRPWSRQKPADMHCLKWTNRFSS